VVEEEVFGAVSSPNIPSPYLEFGGVTRWAGSKLTMNQATTTFCTFQSPNASSTLVSVDVYIDIGTTTAMVVEIAKAPAQATTGGTPNATTTLINSYAVAANSKAMIHASTSRADVLPESLDFAARVGSTTNRATVWVNDFLVVKAYGLGALWNDSQTFSPTGHCQVEWRQN
ncbi:hypothetical protein LCGC14_2680610, partial [marine sediment metagenome]